VRPRQDDKTAARRTGRTTILDGKYLAATTCIGRGVLANQEIQMAK
jgi:hypothetical protein